MQVERDPEDGRVLLSATEKALYDELTPRGNSRARRFRELELEHRRERQKDSAWHWLTTGENPEGAHKPPYGSAWDRDYNPQPYPEAVPDPDFYEGCEIGALYGFPGAEHHVWQLAGWNLVRTGSESRKRRK